MKMFSLDIIGVYLEFVKDDKLRLLILVYLHVR